MLIGKAELAGVERMPLAKFIEQSGWRTRDRWSGLAATVARAHSRTETDERTPIARPSTESNFAKRRPWRPPAAASPESDSKSPAPAK